MISHELVRPNAGYSALHVCLASVAAILFLNGCATVPKPEEPAEVAAISGTESYLSYTPESDVVPTQQIMWWQYIGGDELAGQVARLLTHNFELREARQRLLQTRERARQARAARLPVAGAEIGVSANRTSDLFGDYSWSDGYSAGLSVNYDTDIFGGLRATERAAQLLGESAHLNYIASEQQSIAALAKSWVAAATLKRRLALAREFAESYRETYRLTDDRYQVGSASASATDVLIARQNLEAALADIPSVETQLATQLLAIDKQLGMVPGATAESFQGEAVVEDAMIAPVGLPASLLVARPDVAAAELTYRAALEDIGAARADLLPGLSLSGALSFQNSDPSGLFNIDEYIANLAASFAQPVFQGGRLRSQLRVEQSEAEELATAYAREALAALTEVETALAQQAGLLDELSQLRKALHSAEKSNQIAQDRYRQGLQPLLSILETQRGLNNAQLNIVLAEQQILEARINLHLSLGGSWFDDTDGPWEEPAPSQEDETP